MQNSNLTRTTENRVIRIDEAQIRNHLCEVVRSRVEETLNDMLDAEAISSAELKDIQAESIDRRLKSRSLSRSHRKYAACNRLFTA